MAVIQVIERWQGRTGSTDEKGVRTLNREWSVKTSADTDGIPTVVDGVIAADATAALFASHPDWPPALCRKIDPSPNGGPRVWLVKATYSTAPFAASGDGSGSGGSGGAPLNPTTPNAAGASQQTRADQRAPTITKSKRDITKALEFDAITDDAVTNNVGDRFDPPYEVQRAHAVYTAKFFRTPAQLDWANRSAWEDSINQEPVEILGMTYPALSLRCTAYDLDTVWDTADGGLSFFFALTVQVEHNPDGWKPRLLNRGRRKLVPGLIPRVVNIVDEYGQPVAEPVPLDVNGVPVTSSADYHYVRPNGYQIYDWNGADGKWTGAGGILG